jgi:protein-S-isoprenylcysteine O-methyltransferase Ste14
MCVSLGAAFVSDSAHFLLLSAVPSFLYYHLYVLPREEEYLQQLFGEQYVQYKRRVPRWLLW